MMRRLHAIAQAMLAAAAMPMPAAAQPALDPLFTDGAVLQRDHPIYIRGTTVPGEKLRATLGPANAQTIANKEGRFEFSFPAMTAGGPYRLTITGASGSAGAGDLLMGDVFLCSGQSNMELSVARAQDGESQVAASADPQLRLFTIQRGAAHAPKRDFGKVSGWAAAAPGTVPDFSAACFYMAQDIRRTANVPVGAIHSSWGGSHISAWMGDPALRASDQGGSADLLALYVRDQAIGSARAGEAWEAWWRGVSGDTAGEEPWQPDAALVWQAVPRIGYWEDWGIPELKSFNGMLWFRRVVTLTAEQARQAATLAIGPVDDADQTWVNGRPVGSGGNPGKPRLYLLRPGALHAGRNVISVNADDSYGRGGMPGPAEAIALTLADGSVIPLGDGWDYAIERRSVPRPPRAPWEDTAGAGTIYNAMVAPLGRIGLKGVAWYQGESDVDLPGYAKRMAALMADWRRQFGVPDLPFAIVQLAGFGRPNTVTSESGWAALREQQRRVVADDRSRAALALAIDLGDPLDIHPGEKREVGRRLARAMRNIAYDATEPPSGPRIASARRTIDGGAILTFTDVTGSLTTRSSAVAIGFELCGAASNSCRYAIGKVRGSTVTLTGDGQPLSRIRYAWADSPVVNLYDEASLPAGPFEVDVR